MDEKLGVEGEVVIEELKDGKWIEVLKKKNRIVDAGLNLIMNRLAEDTQSPLSYIVVGDDDTPIVDTQTALGNEIMKKAITEKVVSDSTLILSTTFNAGEATGVWKECGLTNDSVLFNRVLINYTKESTANTKVKFKITIGRK